VELGRHWYDRDMDWKLNEAHTLFDMRGAPFAETPVPPGSQDKDAAAACRRLQAVLDELNPAGGYLDPGDGSGKRAGKLKLSQASVLNPWNMNADDQ
jgi:hypothetical protein